MIHPVRPVNHSGSELAMHGQTGNVVVVVREWATRPEVEKNERVCA